MWGGRQGQNKKKKKKKKIPNLRALLSIDREDEGQQFNCPIGRIVLYFRRIFCLHIMPSLILSTISGRRPASDLFAVDPHF